jgi:hypothetical protein
MPIMKPKLVQIIFKNSVRTAKKTQHFTITKINWLTVSMDTTAVYSENHKGHVNTFRGEISELWSKGKINVGKPIKGRTDRRRF